jgi:hypothetical protein
MAWSFTDLHYGWKIAAGISLAAVTIYVASNTRERVNQADIIELVLGTTERCLATQYSTNPVSYYVSPPSFVRSWYSNAYDGTNVILYTNTFTNVIGWRMDRAMMVSLDSTIKGLVPHYCDTNTVYDGTTNIVMLTVTGLWASLGIGDGTNQFTSVPEWVGTNGTTNVATYGNLPWRIYKEDLEERYKVLNALQYRFLGSYVGTTFPEVIRTATIYGQGDTATGGYCNVWYSKYGASDNNLGPADGTGYKFIFDTRKASGVPLEDYILFGANYEGLYDPIIMLNVGNTRDTTYTTKISLDSPSSIIKIWNCILTWEESANHAISYTASSVDVRSCFSGHYPGAIDIYHVLSTIKFPFQYCTNKYW